jgi:hypothetical protein
MRFYVDKEKEEAVRVFLRQESSIVHVMGEDHTGRVWTLFSLLPDGTFRRAGSIKSGIGIQVDRNGRIKETKDF